MKRLYKILKYELRIDIKKKYCWLNYENQLGGQFHRIKPTSFNHKQLEITYVIINYIIIII